VKRIFKLDFIASGETNYNVWFDKSEYKSWFIGNGIIEHLNFSRRTK